MLTMTDKHDAKKHQSRADLSDMPKRISQIFLLDKDETSKLEVTRENSSEEPKPKCCKRKRQHLVKLPTKQGWRVNREGDFIQVIERKSQGMSHRKRSTFITNITQIILGAALTQIGIVTTWYEKSAGGFLKKLPAVIFLCLIFILAGAYGIFIKLRKLRKVKLHRIMYTCLVALCIAGSVFIIVNTVRVFLIEERGGALSQLVLYSFTITITALELPCAGMALYFTFYARRGHSKLYVIGQAPAPQEISPDAPTWRPWVMLFLNVGHIVLGACACELAMVGMIYRRFMNIGQSSLFSTVFISVTFPVVGIFGIYNHIKRKTDLPSMIGFSVASGVSACCAACITANFCLAFRSREYYSGFEAIVAFDCMILLISCTEILVSIATMTIGSMRIYSEWSTKRRV